MGQSLQLLRLDTQQGLVEDRQQLRLAARGGKGEIGRAQRQRSTDAQLAAVAGSQLVTGAEQ